jgi:hypothetical protein
MIRKRGGTKSHAHGDRRGLFVFYLVNIPVPIWNKQTGTPESP